MSNSNFNITKVTVDPVSQEITNLEINGKAVETGGGGNLEEVVFDPESPLNVEHLFGVKPSVVQILPSEDFDGIELLTIKPGGLTGYPEAFDPTKLSFLFSEYEPDGERLLGDLSQSGGVDDRYYTHVYYDGDLLGYIITGTFVSEEP